MPDRRRSDRKQARIPVRFRILREGPEVQMSAQIEATIRDINLEGLSMETPCVEVDGIHISYNDHPGNKNRIFLQWELPSGKSIKAVGETVWYERISTDRSAFLAGLKFREIPSEDRKALMEYLHPLRRDDSLKV